MIWNLNTLHLHFSFIKLNDRFIKKIIKEKSSPRHLPDEIISVPDIPYTTSGKKLEIPIKKMITAKVLLLLLF